MVAEPLQLTAPARMATTTYPPQVEQWRSMAEKYFPGEVDKVLYLINGESGGNPTIKGDGGLAHGLFQSHYTTGTPEEQFQDARRLYDADKANGGTGYGDWGEGRLYNGQPFGALGRNPYGGYTTPATGTTATATASLPSPQLTLDNVRPAMPSALADSTATAQASQPSVELSSAAPAFQPDTSGGSTLSKIARIGSSAIGSIPGTGVVGDAVSSVANTAANVASTVADEAVQFASAVPGKVMEAPYFRTNPVDIAAAALDADPNTSPAGVAASQAGPAEDQQYPAGQSLAAKVARSVTNPANYVIGAPAPLLDAASAVAAPIGEALATEAGVSPTIGSLVGGASPSVAISGRNIIKGVTKGITGDEVPPTTAAAAPKDQLVTHLRTAATARPELLAARRSELGRRIGAAAIDLENGGVPAREAFERATRQLGGGALASDVFATPTTFDDSLFQATVDYSKRTGDFFTGKQASDGLKLLEQGRIPRPFEVEAIGKVFGDDVATAIDDIGDVFKVKRTVETAFTGTGDVPITLGPDGSLSAENVTAAVTALLPKGSRGKSITGAVQQLIDEERLVAAVTPDGKTVLRLRGPQVNAVEEAVRAARGVGDVEPVPAQTVPPGQRNLFDEEQAVMPPAAGTPDYTIPETPPPTGPTLNQLRLNRGLQQAESTTFRGEGSSTPPPRNPRTGQQAGFGWEPGGTPLWKKSAQFAGDILLLLPRAFQTAFDYSYPLRQGGLIGVRHQKEFWPNFVKGLKAFGSEDYAIRRQAQIERAPYNSRMLDLTDWRPGSKLTEMEEGFMTRLANLIPGIRQSTRAATVFINGLRSDVLNTFVRTQLRHGVPLDEAMRSADDYANFINRATGRGNLGNLESSLPVLNQVFYSLRRNVAMAQAPGYLFHSNNVVAKEVWLDFLAFMGVGAATLKLAELAGADVGIDPTSADFGKIRVGNTRVDIWGGYQQMVRTLYKVMDGQIKDPGSSEEFMDAVAPFIGNKLSPVAGAAVNQYDKARDIFYPGTTKKTPTQTATNLLGPLGVQGFIEAVNEDGMTGGLISLTGFFGTGVNAYTAAADIGADEIRDGVKSGNLPATYLDVNGQPQPVTNLRQLAAADPEAADRFLADNPSIAKDRYEAYGELTRKVRDEQKKLFDRQTDRDNELLTTNPEEWRKASSDDANTTRAYIDGLYSSEGEFERKPESLLDVAQQKYHEAIVAATDKKTTKVDWDAVDRSLAEFSTAEQELIFKSSLKGETEARKQYIRDIKQLAPYFDVRDQAWADISGRSKTLSQYKNYDDFRQSIVDRVYAQTGSHSLAETMADSALSDLSEIMSLKATSYLSHNRSLVPLLDKYGFYVPALLRPLTVNTSTRNPALQSLETP